MTASRKFVQRVWQEFISNQGHDYNSFGHLKVLTAVPGKVTAEMEVKPHQVNRLKTLHGGLTSSLVDTMGSLAIASKGLHMTGVSTDIHVTFVRAAKLGEKVNVMSEVVGQGKTLAYTRVEVQNATTGKLVAFGSHTKFIQEALKGSGNVKFSEDGESELGA